MQYHCTSPTGVVKTFYGFFGSLRVMASTSQLEYRHLALLLPSERVHMSSLLWPPCGPWTLQGEEPDMSSLLWPRWGQLALHSDESDMSALLLPPRGQMAAQSEKMDMSSLPSCGPMSLQSRSWLDALVYWAGQTYLGKPVSLSKHC